MSPAEYGRHLARQTPPVSDAVIESAARILAGLDSERDAA